MAAHVQVSLVDEDPLSVSTALLVVPVFEAGLSALGELGEALTPFVKVAEAERFKGRRGQTLVIPTFGKLAADRLALVGLGARDDWHVRDLRGCLVSAAALAWSRRLEAFSLVTAPLAADADAAALQAAAAEGAAYAGYRFDRYRKRSDDEAHSTLSEIQLIGAEAADEQALARGRAIGAAVCLARDLVNEPPRVCTPAYLVARARELASEGGLDLYVIEGVEALEAESLGLAAAVGRGSNQEPVLIHLTYRAESVERRVALVGKGVTYDSGGYSLKPPNSQIGMHGDMAGAAAVLGAAQLIAQLKPAGVEVHFVVPSAENLVSDRAYKVNDVLTAKNGKTVEVNNTDAEGRLLLGDALCYVEELGVDEIVDIATLTGANVVALGGIYAGVYCDDADLLERFMASADETGEAFWRLPLEKRLAKRLKSTVADLKNSGGRPGSGITAALFLQNFVESTPWLHVDMAGLGMNDDAWSHLPKGASGFGAATLGLYAAGLAG